MMPDAGHNVVNAGMHHRFAAGNSDDRRAKFGKLVDPSEHHVEVDRIAGFVVFVAVSAGKITPAHRHDVYQYRMFGRNKRLDRVLDPACKSAETACLWHI